MGGVFGAALLLGLGVAVANFHCNALLQLYKGQLAVLYRVNTAFGVGAVLAPLLVVGLGYGVLALVALAAAGLLWKAPAARARPWAEEARNPSGLLPYALLAMVSYVAWSRASLDCTYATWATTPTGWGCCSRCTG